MGRNAKLRSRRCSEAEEFQQRHQGRLDEIQSNVSHIGGVTVSEGLRHLLRDLGADLNDLPSPEECAKKAEAASPLMLTLAAGKAYSSILLGTAPTLGQEMQAVVHDLTKLPDELVFSWYEWQGVLTLKPHANADWSRLRHNLVSITTAPELQEGLRAFSSNEPSEGFGKNIISLMQGSLYGWPINALRYQLTGDLTETQVTLMKREIKKLGDHLESQSDLANGRLLCDAGQLVLHYRRAKHQKDSELCLSYRHPDGLLTFHLVEGTPIPFDAIKKLRAFIGSYRGVKMAGEISNHPSAERLCRLIGLSIRHGHGILEAGK